MTPMRRQRVLILDDRAGIGTLSRFFERLQYGRHYEVLAASNPAQAISALKQGSPELIVLDPQLEGLDGLRLLKQIRTLDASIPVIVVTGQQAAQDATEVLRSGVFAHVPKPCDFASLDHLLALAPTDANSR